MWQPPGILNVFNTLTLKQIFWKVQTLFNKLEYHFLVESSKIESATFPYKTALSEANVKTNRMGSTKWAYHKERGFASNYFHYFRNFIFILALIRSWFVVPTTRISIFILFVRAGVLLEGTISLWVTLIHLFWICI